MVKNDEWIVKMSKEHSMIEPFSEEQVSKGVVSYGVSSYGYDLRISNIFKVPVYSSSSVLDPKTSGANFDDIECLVFVLQPSSFVLARSLEYFRIPRDILGLVTGKSTYARCGLLVNVTPLEPEWEGFITISISNVSHVPVRIYADEGIGQVLFLKADEPCRVSYADRKGKYQAQTGIATGRVS